MNMNIFYVYEHWRLDRDECFYVGKGKGNRAYDMRKRNRHHKGITAKVRREGFAVEVKFFAYGLSEEDAFALERERIAFWRKAGVDLANMTDGGEGLFNPSEEVRAKISVAKKGKISCRKGVKLSKETRAKLSAAAKGKRHSEKSRAKMSSFRKGRISNRKGVKLSDEQRAKLSAALKGRTFSEETRAKLSEAAKRQHARAKGLV